MDEPIKWEYRVYTAGTTFKAPGDEELQEMLNEWGAEGWEIFSLFQHENSVKWRVAARRPLTDRERRKRSVPG